MPVSAIMYISPIWSPVSGFPASVSKDELADLEWQVDADIYDESSRTAAGFTANPPSGSGQDTARKEQAAPKSPRKTVASLKAKEADEAKKHAEAEKTAKIAWEAKKKAELAKETARKPNERKMPKRQRQRRQRNWKNRQKTPANLQSRRQKRWQQRNLKEWPGSSGLQPTQRPERPEG